MAEGGRKSILDNLCQNEVKKQLGGKSIDNEEKSLNNREQHDEKSINGSDMSAFPELPSSSLHTHSYLDGHSPVPVAMPPAHNHSAHSATAMKVLDEAPGLSPAVSEMYMNGCDQNAQRNTVDTKTSVEAPFMSSQALNTPPPFRQDDANMINNEQEQLQEEGMPSISFPTSYMLVEACGSERSTQGALSTSTNPQAPTSIHKPDDTAATNDLSGSKPAQQPAPIPQPMPAMCLVGPGQSPHMMANMMAYSVPMGYTCMQPPLPHFVSPMLGSVGAPALYPLGPHMMPNISSPPQLMTGGTGPGPLTATYSNSAGHPALDSRNIPANPQGPSPPSSEENNTGGSRSYSINPGYDTRLVRLRKPVLEWLRTKLDTRCFNNWEALADVRGWNYEEIRIHLMDCRHKCDSPFLTLLETNKFRTYTVQDLLQDMKLIERQDILMDFMDVMRNTS